MSKIIKAGKSKDQQQAEQAKVTETVLAMIQEIEQRGDAAVADYSKKLDNWLPEAFRLSKQQIEAVMQEVPQETQNDIKFAQEQIRRFAQVQKEALRDVEVETLPGVFLGHKNIPVNSVGCYIPGAGIRW